ncbi:hypothetical protein M9H77_30526 [Catharanthus roseus]|uniref:Uncharacterized protein n=1 Tax=Catharanthus roseus TaxID=4058 RepID=A0ACB9ZZJ7_CATRO|nr:hypothetical protein M9H77_30526 [Catharanthus roseus]
MVPKPQASTYKSWLKKEDTPKMAFKNHSKPKVEEKGRLITNPTRASWKGLKAKKGCKLFSKSSISKDQIREHIGVKHWLSLQRGHPIVDGKPAHTVAGRLLPAILLEKVTYCARNEFSRLDVGFFMKEVILERCGVKSTCN